MIIPDDKTVHASSQKSNWTRFERVALPLLREGLWVMPRDPVNKKPFPSWKNGRGAPDPKDPASVTKALRSWAQQWPDADGIMSLTAQPNGVDLDVVDVDHLPDLQWVLDTFGDTPLRVSTGREGGGVHLYYRRDKTWSGSRKTYTQGGPNHKTDFLTATSLVVAPGSTHKTGAAYKLCGSVGEITIEVLRNLPVLDWGKVERHISECKRAKARSGKSVPTGITEIGLSSKPRTERVSKNGTVTQTVEPNQWVLDASRRVGTGGSPAPCPVVVHRKNPESGTLNSRGGVPESLWCHACQVLFLFQKKEPIKEPLRDPVSPERRAEALAEHKADQGEAWVYHTLKKLNQEPFEGEIARRVAESNSLDPVAVELARIAVADASSLRPYFRKHFRFLGVKKAEKPCGSEHAVRHMSTNRILIRLLPCRKLSCPKCGPWMLSLKTAAVRVAASTGGVTFYQSMPTTDFDAWRMRFNRPPKPQVRTTVEDLRDAYKILESRIDARLGPLPDLSPYASRKLTGSVVCTTGATIGKSIEVPGCANDTASKESAYMNLLRENFSSVSLSRQQVYAPEPEGWYVAFQVGSHTHTLSNRKLPGSIALWDMEVIRVGIAWLFLSATKFDTITALTSLDSTELDSDERITCKVTSARSLKLNPEEVVKTARLGQNRWVRMEMLGSETIRNRAKNAGLVARDQGEGPVVDTGELLTQSAFEGYCTALGLNQNQSGEMFVDNGVDDLFGGTPHGSRPTEEEMIEALLGENPL